MMFSKIAGFIMSIVMFICSLLGINFGKADSGEIIQQDEKSSFSISVEENATTGYRWSCKIDNEKIVKLTNDKNVYEDKGLIGAPTTRVFTFGAVKEGKTTITLSYERSWEKEPIRVITIAVEVLPDLTVTSEVISDISK